MFAIMVAQLMFAAPAPSASVTGTIRDASSGMPLLAAAVALSDAGRDVFTDENGRFAMTNTPRGSHRMTVRCLGHVTRTLELLVPERGSLSIDVALEPIATRLAPILVVRDRTPADSQRYGRIDGTVDRVVTSSLLARHPLLSEPDVLRAVSGGDVFARPETAGGLFVRGGSADQVAYSIDGIPVFNVAHLGGLLGAWNTDALSVARLSADAPDMKGEGVLSGSFDAQTRIPGRSVGLRTALSSTQLRLTADGPLAGTAAGYLFSVRQAVPTLGTTGDPNLVRGESGDWLGKLSVPVLRGTLQITAYASGDEFTSSRVVAPAISFAPRNNFAWESRSIGASWVRARQNAELRAIVWRAGTRGAGDWSQATTDSHLDSRRTDYGLQFIRQPRSEDSGTSLSARFEVVNTSYFAHGSDSTGPVGLQLNAVTPVATLSGERYVTLAWRARASVGTAISLTRHGAAVAPRARIEWRPATRLILVAAASRSLQQVQSLRNTESIVSHMFPVDLYIGSSSGSVPTARSDQASLTAELHPAASVTLSALAYVRAMHGVLLAAERESGPFAVAALRGDSFSTGTASAVGAATQLRYVTARTVALLTYGWQRVRYGAGTGGFSPEHSARHRVDAGVTVDAFSGLQLRVGGTAAYGRRATAARGAVEWDGCNLADRACEFAGTPTSSPDALGALSLPHYMRTDIGIRKEWHRILGGRASTVAAYGTVTNLFNRTNFLNLVEKDAIRSGVEMRSRTPLVVGMEWQF